MAEADVEKPTTAAPAEEASDTVKETESTASKQNEEQTHTNGEAEGNKAAEDSKGDEPTSNNESPASDRKRKHSPARDDRDWRTRREEDNQNERRGGRGGGFRGRGRGNDGGRGSGRYGLRRDQPFKDYSENIKSKYDNQPESSDPDDIRKQVEFYFSDSNLPLDKFLLSSTGGSENKPVPVKVIHSFKRMKRFQPYSAVVAALRDSDFLNVTGAEGNEEIARKVALKGDFNVENPTANLELMEDESRPRSIYAKGFGDEGPTTQTDIENFFEPYGPIKSVRLRRAYPEKTFKGSVFVEFDSEETAQQFLELEKKPKWKGADGNEVELKVMSKQKYVVGKANDVAEGKIIGNQFRGRGRGGGRGRGSDRGGRGRGRGDRRDRGRDRRDYGRDRGGDDRRDRNRSDDKNEDGDAVNEKVSEEKAKADQVGEQGEKTGNDADGESKKRSRDDNADGVAADDGEKDSKKARVEV